MMESELLQRVNELLVKLEKGNAPTIWSKDDIAEWLGMSDSTVRKVVVVRPGFPAPIMATGAKEGQKRWFADEVIEWVRKNRGTLPVGRRSGRPRRAA
jgi:predicted DNA-binding transcriptional regulator AlpA